MRLKIIGPNFTSEVELRNNRLIYADDNLAWMKDQDWNLAAIIEYCKRKKWKFEITGHGGRRS